VAYLSSRTNRANRENLLFPIAIAIAIVVGLFLMIISFYLPPVRYAH